MKLIWFLSLIMIASYPSYGNKDCPTYQRFHREAFQVFKAHNYAWKHFGFDHYIVIHFLNPSDGLKEECDSCLKDPSKENENCVRSYRKSLATLIKNIQEECIKQKPDDSMCGRYSGNNAINIFKEYREVMQIIE